MFINRVLYILIILILFFPLFLFGQEQITITTYYPSPFGNYRELRSRRMAIGSNYYNSSQVCWDTGCSTIIPPATHLVVEGRVGIGTPTPKGSLEVNMNNTNDYFLINIDNNIGLELRSGTSGGTPYIDFSNDATSDYDFRIQLKGDNMLDMRGGEVYFLNKDGSYTNVRVKEIWFCSD